MKMQNFQRHAVHEHRERTPLFFRIILCKHVNKSYGGRIMCVQCIALGHRWPHMRKVPRRRRAFWTKVTWMKSRTATTIHHQRWKRCGWGLVCRDKTRARRHTPTPRVTCTFAKAILTPFSLKSNKHVWRRWITWHHSAQRHITVFNEWIRSRNGVCRRLAIRIGGATPRRVRPVQHHCTAIEFLPTAHTSDIAWWSEYLNHFFASSVIICHHVGACKIWSACDERWWRSRVREETQIN